MTKRTITALLCGAMAGIGTLFVFREQSSAATSLIFVAATLITYFVVLLLVPKPAKQSSAQRVDAREQAVRDDVTVGVLVHLIGTDLPELRAKIIFEVARQLRAKAAGRQFFNLRDMIFEELVQRAGMSRRVASVALAGEVTAKFERHFGGSVQKLSKHQFEQARRLIVIAAETAMGISSRFLPTLSTHTRQLAAHRS